MGRGGFGKGKHVVFGSAGKGDGAYKKVREAQKNGGTVDLWWDLMAS
jgi:hypothetical protein